MADDVIDIVILDEFLELMEDSALVMLEMYRNTIPEIFAKTYQALDAGDAEVVHREIHGLKSNCRQIGAMGMGTDAAAIESKAGSGDLSTALSDIQAMEAKWQQVDVILAEKMAQLT